jgi:hypothetical protein
MMRTSANPYAEAHERRTLAQLNAEFMGETVCPELLARIDQRAAELGLGPVRWDALSRLVVRADEAPSPRAARFG